MSIFNSSYWYDETYNTTIFIKDKILYLGKNSFNIYNITDESFEISDNFGDGSANYNWYEIIWKNCIKYVVSTRSYNFEGKWIDNNKKFYEKNNMKLVGHNTFNATIPGDIYFHDNLQGVFE